MSSRRTTLVVVGLVLAFLAPMSTAYALWSRTASASLDVTVQPAGPTIACGGWAGNGKFTITWTNGSGPTYTVQRSLTTNTDGAFQTQAASTSSPYTANLDDGTTTFWRVRASNATTGWSASVRLTRAGNGNGTISCAVVTP